MRPDDELLDCELPASIALEIVEATLRVYENAYDRQLSRRNREYFIAETVKSAVEKPASRQSFEEIRRRFDELEIGFVLRARNAA